MNIRVIQWNVSYNSKKESIISFIKQNISRNTIINLEEILEPTYKELLKAFPDYKITYSLNYRKPGFYEGKNRRMGICTIVTDGDVVNSSTLNNTVFPERTLLTTIKFKNKQITNLAFHSLTGCDYKNAKSSNFASIASFLHDNKVNVMTFDANEPDVDSINEDDVIFFNQKGEQGKNASLLLGANKVHDLVDGFRDSIKGNKKKFEAGFTHIVRGRNKKRYDYIFGDKAWVLKEFRVLFDDAVKATSDHAMLIAEYEV